MLDQRLKKTFIIVKGMATWLMIEIHVIGIVSLLYGQALFKMNGPHNNLPMPLSIFGLYTLSFPILSGCVLRSTLDNQILRQRLIDIDWNKLLQIVYFLFLVEGLRNFLLRFSVTDALAWNVLQTVALSFILISSLMRRSLKLLVGASLAILLVTPIVHQVILPVIPSLQKNFNPESINKNYLSLCYSLILGLFFSLPLFFSIKKKSLRFISSSSLFVLAALVFYFKLKSEIEMDLKFLYTLIDLPFALWTGGGQGQVYWPFLNWFPSIAFGFIFTHLMLGYREIKYVQLTHLLSAILSVIYFKFYFQSEYIDRLNNLSLFTSDFFSVSPMTIIGIISFFVCHFLAVWFISHHFRIRSRGLIHVYSRSLLYIYFFHTVFAWWFARLLKELDFTFMQSMLSVLIMTTLASYWFGLLVINRFDKSDVEL